LRRNARPAVIAQHAAAQAPDGERAFARRQAAQFEQSFGDSPNGGRPRIFQRLRQLLRPLERFVHNNAPIHDEPNAPRRGALVPPRLRREGIHGDVEASCFPARRWQVNRLRPFAGGGPLGEHRLPGEGILFPKRAEEIRERRKRIHDSTSTGRHKP
jgi:hypothetical protein